MPYIAVVEDDNNIQKLITYALSSNGFEALGYSDGAAFLASAQNRRPDLVILDIMMPGIDGMQVLKKMREGTDMKCTPVMMLTAKNSEIDKVGALDMGADDYMTKPFGVMEMLSRVKALLRRSRMSTGASTLEEALLKPAMKFREITLDENKHRVITVQDDGSEKKVDLTLKEFELLNYLMHNQGLVLSRDKIMQKVWGYDYEGESRTVDMHIKWLRHKLGTAGEYIKTIRGVGYCLTEEL